MGPPTPSTLRHVDVRRQIFQDFKRLWKYSGHGVYKVNAGDRDASDEGGERAQITHHLRANFGETFAEGAPFYSDPDRDRFVAYLLHAASKGAVAKNADVSRVFTSKDNARQYDVDDDAIRDLGCTRGALYELFRGFPTADERVRVKDGGRALVFARDDTPATARTTAPLALPSITRNKLCLVDGCRNSRDTVFKKKRACSAHATVSSVVHRGTPSRYCQTCNALHPLTEFDGEKRTCAKKLEKLKTVYKAKRAERELSASRFLHDRVLRKIHEDTTILLRRDPSFEVTHLNSMFDDFTNAYVRKIIAGEFSMIPGDRDFKKATDTIVDFFWIAVLWSVYPTTDVNVNGIFRGGSEIDEEWFEAIGLDVSTLLERVRASWSDVSSRMPRWGTTKKRTRQGSPREQNAGVTTPRVVDESKECFKCGVVQTPQWRQGPDGPGTLCNACGVSYRKIRDLTDVVYRRRT